MSHPIDFDQRDPSPRQAPQAIRARAADHPARGGFSRVAARPHGRARSVQSRVYSIPHDRHRHDRDLTHPESRAARSNHTRARAHHCCLAARRDRSGQRPARPGCAAGGGTRTGSRPRCRAGHPRACAGEGPERGRVLHAPVRPVQRGRHPADVRGRGAAAHPGQDHHRQADPRQARRRQLAQASGPQRIAAGQRLHLGPAAHRPAGQPGRRQRRRFQRRTAPAGRPRGRPRDPRGGAPGHAHHGPPVRDGPRYRGSARPQPEEGERGVPLLLRHAGRVGVDRRHRRALPAGLPQRDRRAGRARPVCEPHRRAVDLGEIVGAVPALRSGPARTGAPGAHRKAAGAVAAGDEARHRAVGRRRGGRPAGAVAGRDRRCLRAPLAGRLERPGHRGAGVRQAHAVRDRLAGGDSTGQRPALVRAAGQGCLLGRRDQEGAGAGPGRLPGVHPQAEYRRLLSGLRAAPVQRGRQPDLSAVRHPQRAHHRRRAPHRAGPAVRVPAPARHGQRPVCRGDRQAELQRALPRVCAGRLARGPAALPGAPPARERRQHQLRQPRGGRGRARARAGGRPLRDGARVRSHPAPAHPAAGQSLR